MRRSRFRQWKTILWTFIFFFIFLFSAALQHEKRATVDINRILKKVHFCLLMFIFILSSCFFTRSSTRMRLKSISALLYMHCITALWKSLKPLSDFKSRKTFFFITMALISRYDRARVSKCWVIDIQRWCMRITGLSLDRGEKNPISMLTQTDLNLYEIWHIFSHVKGPPVCNIAIHTCCAALIKMLAKKETRKRVF